MKGNGVTSVFEGAKPPTVLQVVPALETGGAERTAVDIARALVEAGAKALVASRGGRMVAELEAAGATHIELAVHSKNPVVMALNVERLTRLAAKHGADIIHARSRAPAWSALAAARRLHLPFVTTYHNKVHESPRLKVFYNSVMTRGAVVIANSHFTAERIRKVHGEDRARIVTVPRGIDMARFNPARIDPERIKAMRLSWRVAEDDTVFLLPARLTRWKGQTVALEALAKLKNMSDPPFRLVLVGDAQGRDAYEAELSAMISRLGLQDHARLAGHCEAMEEAYAAADFVIAPSLEAEPFGRTPVEAQAMGRPPIVADHGGARETVITAEEDAPTGWRVPPGDDVALAGAMLEALSLDAKSRAEMAARGKAHVAAHFSLTAMAAATLKIYADLMQQKPE